MLKLAIIGAGYLQLPLVKKAKTLGIETHCFSWEEGAVCRAEADYFYPISITEKERILSICEEIGINGVLTIASDLAVVTVNYIARIMSLVGNSMECARVATNKFEMRQRFDSFGVASPKYCLFRNLESLPVDVRFPLIVKPVDRSGSLGVAKVDCVQELLSAAQNAHIYSFSMEVIVEEFIEGREISVECISYHGKHYLLAITDKITTSAPYFVEIAHHQPAEISVELQHKIEKLTFAALDALQIENGASHTEIKITAEENLFVIEVGARMGGDFIGSHLVQLSTGYDFLQGVIDVSLGKFSSPDVTNFKNNSAGVCFLSEESLYLKSIIKNWEKYPEIVETKLLNENISPLRSSSDRSGYLIYKGEFSPFMKSKEKEK